MIVSGLCRVAATAHAGRPASRVTCKSAVVAQYTHGHLLAHRVFLHSHHRQFPRPKKAYSAQQQAVAEHPDRPALEASPAQTPEDNKGTSQVAPLRLAGKIKFLKIFTRRVATSEALECLSESSETHRDLQKKAVQTLTEIHLWIKKFYEGIASVPRHYRIFAACRTAVDIAGSAVEARDALSEARARLKETEVELDLARAQGADPKDIALKAEKVESCEAAFQARREEFRKADKAAHEASGVYLDTPSPETRKPEDLKREDYEWMLCAIDEILKYRTQALARYERVIPTEKQIEQRAQEKDEPEQHDGMPETVSEPFAPSKEHEDKLERDRNVDAHRLHHRLKARRTQITTRPDLSQLENSLATHYPPIFFPFNVTLTVLETLTRLLEESCYQFALVHIPHHLAERNWDCPEAVELSTWYETFTELLNTNPRFITMFDTDSALGKSDSVPRQLRILWVLARLRMLKAVRNSEAHRRRLTAIALLRTINAVELLARMLRDPRLLHCIQQLSAEVSRVVTALEARRDESLKAGRTLELWNQIQADQAALQRIRDQFEPEIQASISPERLNAYTMFKDEVERLSQALPVAIQAEEDVRLQAELPSLVKMAETMAEQVTMRNAELQLRMQAARKSKAAVVLERMSLLLEDHKERMRVGSFPYSELPQRGPEELYSPLSPPAEPAPQESAQGTNVKLDELWAPRQEDHEPQENAEPREQQQNGDTGMLKRLEKGEHLTMEDFKKRAMKEMAAVAAKEEVALEQQEEEEMDEQAEVEAGEWQSNDFDTRLAELVNLENFSIQTHEELREKGLTRRAAGIAFKKQLQSSGLLKEYIKRKQTLLDMRRSLQLEMSATQREIRALTRERGAIKRPTSKQKLNDDEPATNATTTKDDRSAETKLTELTAKVKWLASKYDLVTSQKLHIKLQASFNKIREKLNKSDLDFRKRDFSGRFIHNEKEDEHHDDGADAKIIRNSSTQIKQEDIMKVAFNDHLARARKPTNSPTLLSRQVGARGAQTHREVITGAFDAWKSTVEEIEDDFSAGADELESGEEGEGAVGAFFEGRQQTETQTMTQAEAEAVKEVAKEIAEEAAEVLPEVTGPQSRLARKR